MNINFIIKQFLIVIFLTQITVCSTDDKKLSSKLLECLLAECASIKAELNNLDRGLSSMQKNIQQMTPQLKHEQKLELEGRQILATQEYLLNKHLDRQNVMTTIDSVIDQIVFNDEKEKQETALDLAIDHMSLATATERIAPEPSLKDRHLSPLKAPCQKQSSRSNVASGKKLKGSQDSSKKKFLNHEEITQQQTPQLNRQKKLSAQERNDAYNQAQALEQANRKKIQLAAQKRNSSQLSFCSIL